MAVNKVVNRRTNTHAAMRNCIEYVLKEQKVTDGLVYVTGPYPFDDINYDNVYNAFLDEKKLWDKDSGRMYAHNIISFHKDEKITPEEAFEFGKEFADKWFSDFQTLIAVHQDRDHLHIHFVTNTVSYADGHKLHTTKKDLEDMKQHTNKMCIDRGLTVAEKDRHFDGREMEPGEITAWSKDKYNLVNVPGKKSYIVDCIAALDNAMKNSYSREDFISEMLEMGWHVNWDDNRKHITFENEEGMKVRDSNLSKTFNLDISKEALSHEFARKIESRQQQLAAEREREEHRRAEEEQFNEFCKEIESGIYGDDGSGDREPDKGTDDRKDTDAVISELKTELFISERKGSVVESEKTSRGSELRESESERQARDAEQRRRDIEEAEREREEVEPEGEIYIFEGTGSRTVGFDIDPEDIWDWP